MADARHGLLRGGRKHAGLIVAACAAGTAALPLEAQAPLRLTPGWGVDTLAVARGWGDFAWVQPVPEIYRRWRAYLEAHNDGRKGPSPFWSAAEQAKWPDYDLAGMQALQGGQPTVLDIRPASPGDTSAYVVKTLFARLVGDRSPAVKPIALSRVYAVRERGQWVFANALPRLTKEWARERVGPITYVVQPGHRFDRGRAAAAVQFADSVANAFGAPRLAALTYYVTDSPDEMHRIMGLDWFITGGTRGGGYSRSADRLVFSGDPIVGEAYLHELAHFALAPILPSGSVHPMIAEGIASWLGGSLGMDYTHMMRAYAEYLRAHPTVGLETVLGDNDVDVGWRPAGALLCAMVFERGGVPAVKQLLASGRTNDALRQEVGRLLGADWAAVAAAWRRQALAFSTSSSR